MNDYSGLIKLLWIGTGLLGGLLLVQNPDKLVFEDNYLGSIIKVLKFVLLPLSIVLGPISILLVFLLPRRKLCPYCFKAIQKEEMVCKYCSKAMPIESLIQKEEWVNPNPKRHISDQVLAAVKRGTLVVNLPIPFIMIGTWAFGAALGILFKTAVIAVIGLPVGFMAGWLWWSYSVPLWRKWALEQPGVDPEALQKVAERAGLVWPKGHLFEKTEIKPKE